MQGYTYKPARACLNFKIVHSVQSEQVLDYKLLQPTVCIHVHEMFIIRTNLVFYNQNLEIPCGFNHFIINIYNYELKGS